MADPPSNRISQVELDEIIRKHHVFSQGKMGGGRAVLKLKDLSGLHFRHANLSNADFTGSNLKGANLSKGTFSGTIFYSCDMSGANLSYASFIRADMRGADLTDTNATGADLKTADMRAGSKIEIQLSIREQKELAAKVAKAAESEKVIDYGHLDIKETWDTSLDLSTSEEAAQRSSKLVLNAEDSEAYNSNLDLSHKEEPIRKTDLVLGHTTDELDAALRAHALWITSNAERGHRLDISNRDMTVTKDLGLYQLIFCQAHKASFKGLSFLKSQLVASNFDGSDFSETRLLDCDLRGASFKHATFEGAALRHCNFSSLSLSSGKILKANLSGANLRNADLRNTDFQDAILTNVDFTGANLKGANLTGADLTGSIMPNNI